MVHGETRRDDAGLVRVKCGDIRKESGIRNQPCGMRMGGTQDRKWKVERNAMSEQMVPSEDNRRGGDDRAGPKEIHPVRIRVSSHGKHYTGVRGRKE